MFQTHQTRIATMLVCGLLVVGILGCSGAAPTSTPTVAAPTNAPATSVPPTVAPATQAPAPTTASAATDVPATDAAAPASDETVTLVVVPEQSEARYVVQEQLVGNNLPNQAIGRTKAVTGQIVGNMDGTIVSDQSQFVVDVRTLTSDVGMRDNFIQRTPLDTGNYPNVTFVPTSAPGLPLIVPDSGAATFQLIGDLTIKDVTKPVTWEADCELTNGENEALCKASTTFTFGDFSLEQPRVGRVLSIEDNITLQVDLYLQRVTP